MCNVCNGFEWIIGLDGKLKRCPTCSTPHQVDWIEQAARIHELRLGMVDEEAHDTSNDYEHESDGVANGDVESEAAVTGGTGGTGAGWAEWALQLAA